MYTLLLLDSTSDFNTTNPATILHWAVVNIHGSNVTSGEEMVSYHVPTAPTTYNLFLAVLYEQKAFVNGSSIIKFTSSYSSSDLLVGR